MLKAVPSQELRLWIGGDVQALKFMGGMTQLVVPDRLRSGVSQPPSLRPEVDPTYAEMAPHHRTAALPGGRASLGIRLGQ